MPQYLISACHDGNYEVDFSTPEAQRLGTLAGAFNDDLQKAGAWVFAAGLHPASSATVVRSSDGRAMDSQLQRWRNAVQQRTMGSADESRGLESSIREPRTPTSRQRSEQQNAAAPSVVTLFPMASQEVRSVTNGNQPIPGQDQGPFEAASVLEIRAWDAGQHDSERLSQRMAGEPYRLNVV
jgi:hypothetical protein